MTISIGVYPYYGMITHHVRESADHKVDQIKQLMKNKGVVEWFCKPDSLPICESFETQVYSIDSEYIPTGYGGNFKVKTEVGYMYCIGFNARYAPYREVFFPINHWNSLRIYDMHIGNQKEIVSFCKRLGKMIKPIMEQDNEIEW